MTLGVAELSPTSLPKNQCLPTAYRKPELPSTVLREKKPALPTRLLQRPPASRIEPRPLCDPRSRNPSLKMTSLQKNLSSKTQLQKLENSEQNKVRKARLSIDSTTPIPHIHLYPKDKLICQLHCQQRSHAEVAATQLDKLISPICLNKQ